MAWMLWQNLRARHILVKELAFVIELSLVHACDAYPGAQVAHGASLAGIALSDVALALEF